MQPTEMLPKSVRAVSKGARRFRVSGVDFARGDIAKAHRMARHCLACFGDFELGQAARRRLPVPWGAQAAC
jgi:hypothetical protein